MSKHCASTEQAPGAKLFDGHGVWLEPGELFLGENLVQKVLDQSAKNDEAIRNDDHQFRDSTKKTEDVPDTNVGKIPYKKPEIIYCKDCKKFVYDNFNIPYCYRDPGHKWNENDYCSRAERRNDG